MNHLTKGTFVLGALLFAGTLLAQAPNANQPGAQAQMGEHHRIMDPGQQAEHLGKRLGLSNDQVAQIQPILADRMQRVQTLRADNSLSQQDRRSKAQAIMQDSNSKIEAVLSDTQKQQFEQMLTERRNHQHNRQPQSQPQA